jgi:hypothetical protein
MVVGRNRFGPDHAEMMFAIRAHERIVAWHWELLHRGIVQVGEVRGGSLLFLVPRVHEQLYRLYRSQGRHPVTSELRRRRGVEQAKPLLLGEKLELRAVGLGWLF